MVTTRSYATSSRDSSRRTWVSALPRRARLGGSLDQPLAPAGCGSGTATAFVEQEALADGLAEGARAEQ